MGKSIEQNLYFVGERLENLRKEHQYSLEKLENIIQSDYDIKFSRQKYRDCEQGIRNIPLNVLMALADLYSCDIAYILGEIPEHTYSNREICKSLGLTENSIEMIKSISKDNAQLVNILSLLIENQEIVSLLTHIKDLKNTNMLNNTFINSTLNNLLGNGVINNPNMSGELYGGVIKQYETPEQLKEVLEFQIEKIFLSILSDIEKA